MRADYNRLFSLSWDTRNNTTLLPGVGERRKLEGREPRGHLANTREEPFGGLLAIIGLLSVST